MTRQKSEQSLAIAALFFACIIWGVSFTWIKDGQETLGKALVLHFANDQVSYLSPAAFLALRFTVVAICWAILFPSSITTLTRRNVLSGTWGGIFLAAGLWFQHYGLFEASEALTAFLTSLSVFFTPLFAVVVCKQQVNRKLIAPIATAVIGIALMTSFRPEGGFDRGALLGLLCAVAFSGYILVIDRHSRGADVWRFSFVVFASTALLLWLGLIALEDGPRAAAALFSSDIMLQRPVLFPFLFATFIVTIIAFGLMLRYQQLVSPTEAAIIYTTEPIFALLYAWLFAGRGITGEALVGACIVFGASIWAVIAEAKNEKEVT